MMLDQFSCTSPRAVRLRHGGRLREAAARWGIPPEAWLDLSTGINPHGWPVPELSASLWSRLPEDDDDLLAVAAEYYGSVALLPVAGSQAAIQALPRLRPPSRVAVLAPAYAEHAEAWRRAGHAVTEVPADRIDARLAEFEALVLVNPNNPTGATFSRAVLDDWRERLAARGGWLAVDEAFMDATPELSLLPDSPREGLILLRSLGKFFGLAGARVGFASAPPELLARLDALLGPWTIATPARRVAAAALRDRAWQAAMRQRLPVAGERLRTLLTRHGLPPAGGGALFQWVPVPGAAALRETLARRAILTRLFDDPPSLRFGLPGPESDWARLAAALADLEMMARSP